MSSVSQAVAKRPETPGELVARYRQEFATVLPSHIRPDTWVRLAQGALRRNKALEQAATKNPRSLMHALLEAARLGLEPGTDQYYLVPYGSEVTGIVGYQGEIELIYRAGAVSSIKAEIVYSNDEFEFTPDMPVPKHRPDWFGDRGEMIGVYAYAVMKDGATSRVIVAGRADIERVKAMSRGADHPESPWVKWPDRMWLKTAVHQLAKWVPTSAEYRREVARADAAADHTADQAPAPVDLPFDPAMGEILDGELVDQPGGE